MTVLFAGCLRPCGRRHCGNPASPATPSSHGCSLDGSYHVTHGTYLFQHELEGIAMRRRGGSWKGVRGGGGNQGIRSSASWVPSDHVPRR